jgi:hypothetical protein
MLGCAAIAFGVSFWSVPAVPSAARLVNDDGIRPAVSGRHAPVSSRRPPPQGYFKLKGIGSWSSLPGGRSCTGRIHRSNWEPRPQNREENHTMPSVKEVHRAFASRPRSRGGSYARKWDTWLLPRVTGHFTGTTDEIFQWAACKWGLPDNLLRAIGVRESTWYQFLHFRDGSVYPQRGSGDYFSSADAESTVYCDFLARFGHDYQSEMGAGQCPRTFSIAGVMSWQDPSWGRWTDNQNGTFPFDRDSTAFALDFLGSQLRGCFEGWERWLGAGGTGYRAGHIWGCVGAWYAGAWHSGAANDYIAKVHTEFTRRVWRHASFREGQFQCDPVKGCPV